MPKHGREKVTWLVGPLECQVLQTCRSFALRTPEGSCEQHGCYVSTIGKPHEYFELTGLGLRQKGRGLARKKPPTSRWPSRHAPGGERAVEELQSDRRALLQSNAAPSSRGAPRAQAVRRVRRDPERSCATSSAARVFATTQPGQGLCRRCLPPRSTRTRCRTGEQNPTPRKNHSTLFRPAWCAWRRARDGEVWRHGALPRSTAEP